MELNLDQTKIVQEKINEELDWLEYQINKAPGGLQESFQITINKLKTAKDALSDTINQFVITVPAEAQEVVSKYITN